MLHAHQARQMDVRGVYLNLAFATNTAFKVYGCLTQAWLFMKIIGVLLSVFAGCASGGTPAPVAAPPIFAPADACWASSGVCVVTVGFVVHVDGAVSDVSIEKSSNDRPCDLAVKHGVARWRYAPRAFPVRLVERIQAYTCPSRRGPANARS